MNDNLSGDEKRYNFSHILLFKAPILVMEVGYKRESSRTTCE
jgi:hypothetical protein